MVQRGLPVFWWIIKMQQIKSEEVQDWWPSLEPLVKQALCVYGMDELYEPRHIRDFVASGEMQCWVVLTGKLDYVKVVGITQILAYPKGLVAQVLCTASLDFGNDWQQCMENVREWAHLNGCKWVEVYGRQGWKRVLRDFDDAGVVLRRVV